MCRVQTVQDARRCYILWTLGCASLKPGLDTNHASLFLPTTSQTPTITTARTLMKSDLGPFLEMAVINLTISTISTRRPPSSTKPPHALRSSELCNPILILLSSEHLNSSTSFVAGHQLHPIPRPLLPFARVLDFSPKISKLIKIPSRESIAPSNFDHS